MVNPTSQYPLVRAPFLQREDKLASATTCITYFTAISDYKSVSLTCCSLHRSVYSLIKDQTKQPKPRTTLPYQNAPVPRASRMQTLGSILPTQRSVDHENSAQVPISSFPIVFFCRRFFPGRALCSNNLLPESSLKIKVSRAHDRRAVSVSVCRQTRKRPRWSALVKGFILLEISAVE